MVVSLSRDISVKTDRKRGWFSTFLSKMQKLQKQWFSSPSSGFRHRTVVFVTEQWFMENHEKCSFVKSVKIHVWGQREMSKTSKPRKWTPPRTRKKQESGHHRGLEKQESGKCNSTKFHCADWSASMLLRLYGGTVAGTGMYGCGGVGTRVWGWGTWCGPWRYPVVWVRVAENH